MEQFDLVFQGKILEGYDLAGVKRNLSAALKTTEEKVEQLFSGTQIRLKKNLPQEQAEKLQQQLAKLGAQSDLVPCAVQPSFAPREQVQPRTTPAPDTAATEDEYEEIPYSLRDHLTRELGIAAAITMAGIGLMIEFNPFTDGTLKRGLLVGLVVTLLAGRKCSQLLRE